MKACAVPNGTGEYLYTSAVADLHEGLEQSYAVWILSKFINKVLSDCCSTTSTCEQASFK